MQTESFLHVDGDIFVPNNFEMHEWRKEPWRNVATIIGGAVSEGLSIGIDYTIGRMIGIPAYKSFSIAGELARGHI